ncbi:MAG: DNA circularization N-terminal domain-containing protein [Deltaproteobacteria bacterium]|nr:DNA circularization N-terminal domain-containing protein [Deltaproteobacteria bacterium]
MSWRDEVRRGSFRGIPLELAELSMAGGKRLVVEEYPEQDEHTVDELGLSPRRFRIGAYLAGDDYLDARDQLLAALDLPGVGELVHPWRGRLQVFTGSWSVDHEEHGGCSVSWDCVLSTTATAPTVTTDPVTDVETKAAAARAEAGVAFEDAAERRAALPSYYASQVSAAIQLFTDTWDDPLGAGFAAITGDEEYEGRLELIFEVVETVRGALAIATGYPAGTPRYTLGTAETPSEEEAAEVLDEEFRALRVGALCRACELAVAATYPHAQAAEADMVAVADAIGDEMASALDAALFEALIDMRAALIAGMTLIAERLPKLREHEVSTPTPTIVLAFDLYEDPTRDTEIEELNAIANPLFAAGTLTVLSE